MRPPKLIEITEIPIDQIDDANRLRPVTEAAVESLIASIETVGLQSEIHVRQINAKTPLRLILGGHRLEAFRRLNRDTIPAKVWNCTDNWAQLSEIDDNLASEGLAPLDLAVFLARRKAVYEDMHPETRATTGADLAARRWNATDMMSTASFVKSSALQAGVSERHIRRLVEVGTKLAERDIASLRTSPDRVTLKDLQVIAKCEGGVERAEVCAAIGTGTAKTAAAYLKGKKALPGAAIQDPIEDALKRLNDAWARAPKEARRRFVRDHGDDIAHLAEGDE